VETVLSWCIVLSPGSVGFIGAKDDGSTGAIRCAKLQSNHHQQTNTQLYSTGRMSFQLPHQQCQSIVSTLCGLATAFSLCWHSVMDFTDQTVASLTSLHWCLVASARSGRFENGSCHCEILCHDEFIDKTNKFGKDWLLGYGLTTLTSQTGTHHTVP